MTLAIVSQETAGTRAMRKDPAYPDLPSDAIAVFDGHLKDLQSWLELAQKHVDANQHMPEKFAFMKFRELVWHVEEALMAVSCDNEFRYGGNCGRLKVVPFGFEGHCEDHADQARTRAAL